MVVLALLGAGTASATSLGTFSPPVGEGFTRRVDPCQATSVRLIDDLTGLPIVEGTLGTYTIASVEFALDGDCAEHTPVVIVYGQSPWGTADKVLARESYPGTDLAGATATVRTSLGDDLLSLNLDPTTVMTETAVAFCPVGRSACLP